MSTYDDTKNAAAQKSEDTKNAAQVMHLFAGWLARYDGFLVIDSLATAECKSFALGYV